MAFTINGQLFLTDIAAGVTRGIAIDEPEFKPVLNPRISPDGRHIMYTTGTYLVDVDLAENTDDGDAVSVVASVPQIDGTIDEPSDETSDGTDGAPAGEWKIGLAEFAAGEEMDRYDGFWWSPDSNTCCSKPSMPPMSGLGTSPTLRPDETRAGTPLSAGDDGECRRAPHPAGTRLRCGRLLLRRHRAPRGMGP
mgnify:CR=1 FL=1